MNAPKLTSDEAHIRRTLAQLRSRIRWYVSFEGLGLAVLFIGLAFWATLGLDRFSELPLVVRVVLMAVVSLGFVAILVQMVGRRVTRSLKDRSLAAVLERRFRTLGDSLLTSVEVNDRKDQPSETGLMVGPARQRAASEVQRIRLSEVFNVGPLRRALVLAVLVTVSIAAFAYAAPRDMRIWTQRWILLDDTPWPKAVHLAVLAPSELAGPDGRLKVARDSEPELLVRAQLNREEFPEADYPKIVQIRYRTRDRFTRNMDLSGEPSADGQEYRFKFAPLSESLEFDLVGGDGRIDRLAIDVVERPVIERIVLHCRYPEYMGLIDARLEASRSMNLHRGTQVRLEAITNKPIEQADIRIVNESGEALGTESISLSEGQTQLWTEFTLMENARVFFELLDTDGISSAKPEVLVLVARSDEPPTVAVRPKGVSIMVTSRARIPMVGTIRDDFGLQEAWLDFQVERATREVATADRGDPETMSELAGDHAELDGGQAKPADQLRQLAARIRGQRDVNLENEAFEVRDLRLVPGDRLNLQLHARDGYRLGEEGPHETSSENFPFRIVTVDQLRAELEMRELSLRQRLESVQSETQGNRRALAERFVPDQVSAGEAEANPVTAPPPAENPQAARELLILQSERSLQLGRKNAAETLGVAEGFEGIVEELINNRVDNLAIRERLTQQVADPLYVVGNEQFPELHERLGRLQQQLRTDSGDSDAVMTAYLACEQQIDTILASLQAVLDRIEKLQDMNELLALFREILQEQEELGLLTEKEKQDAIRRRLEDLGLDLE